MTCRDCGGHHPTIVSAFACDQQQDDDRLKHRIPCPSCDVDAVSVEGVWSHVLEAHPAVAERLRVAGRRAPEVAA